jgi:hypothetical protein
MPEEVMNVAAESQRSAEAKPSEIPVIQERGADLVSLSDLEEVRTQADTAGRQAKDKSSNLLGAKQDSLLTEQFPSGVVDTSSKPPAGWNSRLGSLFSLSDRNPVAHDWQKLSRHLLSTSSRSGAVSLRLSP